MAKFMIALVLMALVCVIQARYRELETMDLGRRSDIGRGSGGFDRRPFGLRGRPGSPNGRLVGPGGRSGSFGRRPGSPNGRLVGPVSPGGRSGSPNGRLISSGGRPGGIGGRGGL